MGGNQSSNATVIEEKFDAVNTDSHRLWESIFHDNVSEALTSMRYKTNGPDQLSFTQLLASSGIVEGDTQANLIAW